MATELGGYYGYALYDECFYENDFVSARPPRWAARLFSPAALRRRARGARSTAAAAPLGERTGGYPCGGDTALAAWVASPVVRRALHIPVDAVYFTGDEDNGCGCRAATPLAPLSPSPLPSIPSPPSPLPSLPSPLPPLSRLPSLSSPFPPLFPSSSRSLAPLLPFLREMARDMQALEEMR
jgi:hypothetical protein